MVFAKPPGHSKQHVITVSIHNTSIYLMTFDLVQLAFCPKKKPLSYLNILILKTITTSSDTDVLNDNVLKQIRAHGKFSFVGLIKCFYKERCCA